MGQGINPPLSQRGIQQASKTAERLKDERIDMIFTSDLARAESTANSIKKFHRDAEYFTDARLRERSLGIYEGKPSTAWRQHMRRSNVTFHLYRPMKGESYKDLLDRASFFFDEILKQHHEKNVLIVSHTGVLTVLYLWLLNRPLIFSEYEQLKPANTALSVYELSEGKQPNFQVLNSTTHLDDIKLTY